ncbi:NADP-dependent oxidoreductase [Microbacterium sp. ET2]|uniref:NADP-dependent oxidoreductase n=1 Tax=Microbacterium albipurpureum TaxID=3050384 RepID=UPI00259C7ADA|nr:NADP-dependent oxidoreductase [Microbacterium sp. ET2 (Ac-2212)]WJL96873.1 NADP-dependent oxidoreductase [Microbacterium sp. ET2 (Ac-2212)]
MAKKLREATVVEYDRPGDADVLEVRTTELRPPGRGEVTVEIITAGISHIDGFIRSGREDAFAHDPFPRRSGSDFAGTIIAVGEDVHGFTRGMDVVGHVRAGAHASAITVSTSALVKKPRAVSWEAAGGLFLAGATGLDILDQVRVGEGDTVVVSAAAGGVGSMEAQFARHRGATVIGTCGERNFDYLRQLGIKPVLYGAGIADRIRKAAGKPITAMIDNFGQDGRALAEDLEVSPSRYRSSEDRRDTEVRLLQDDPGSVAQATSLLERVAQLAEKRAFTLLVSGLYSLGDVAEAYADLGRLHARGKVVLATRPVTTVRTLKARDVWEAAG